MNRLFRATRGVGFAFLVVLLGVSGLVLGLTSAARAQQAYLPDHPLVPTITNTDPLNGAYGLPALRPPAPGPWNQQSIWNMKVVGWMSDLGCSNSDGIFAEHYLSGPYANHEILFVGSATGTVYNPLTKTDQPCGAQIYDVTNPSRPVFLGQIAGTADATSGMPHVFVCSGNTLPAAQKGHYYLLAHRGDTSLGQGEQDIYDVTNPSDPVLLTKIVGNLSEYHRSWWECDTGIAYLIAGGKADGWRQGQHIYIYNLSNPASPTFIRQYGVPGGQPDSSASWPLCSSNPGVACDESTANPPGTVHQCYSTSTGVVTATGTKSIVICSTGVGDSGVVQILDRTKLLNGCNPSYNPAASAGCADTPTQSTGPTEADLTYPQIGSLAFPPYIGGHNDDPPIFNMPIPEDAGDNYPTAPVGSTTLGPQHWDVAQSTSEALGPPTCGTSDDYDHNATLIDITNEGTPWPIATENVPQYYSGNNSFCQKGGRFGDHFIGWNIYAPYYGKLTCITWFNAGLRCFDIRDPLNPRQVAYFIQAPNANTVASCGVPGNPTLCRDVAFMDTETVDDRGYIYGDDRYGSGITVLLPTGDAEAVVTQNLSGHGVSGPGPGPF